MDENTIDMSNSDIYNLFLLFQSLNEMKRSLLMVLAHLYPKFVSIKELLSISGYSTTSKQIFRSETLRSLEIEGLIKIQKDSARSQGIILNNENNLMIKFAQICQTEGKFTTETFLGKLLNV